MKTKILVAILVCSISLLLNASTSWAANGAIEGKITDSKTGEPLPGANVIIIGTSIGAACDLRGAYFIQNVPPGNYTLRVSYIGYEKSEAPIQVPPGEKVSQNFGLSYVGVKTEEVVVSAQAEGQMQAINQQLSSTSIVNVVASDRIQELPDATAAESVGRLPGVSVSRDGGEGTKIIIRGLSSQHNKVNVEGIEVPSTDPENRSVDISMISPYLLDGIEVQKAVTANHDANAMGGTVNFSVREASEGLSFDILAQGVNNGLRNSYDDYKVVGSVDHRFFNNKLGALFLVDAESRARDSETLSADYILTNPKLNQVNTTYVNSILLQDIYRKKDRLGGALVLDYKLPSTKLKLVSFLSELKTNSDIFAKDVDTNTDFVGHRSSFENEKLSFNTNSLSLEQTLFNANLRAKVSRSQSENDVEGAFWNFVKFTLGGQAKVQTSPEGVLQFAQTDTVNEFLRTITLNTNFNKETIWAYQA
ncbi:MAG TPA: carboxypeptidase-like regulatory domain-containing protein, partial [bacterium]